MFKTAALTGVVSGRQKIAAEKKKKKSGGGLARGMGGAAGALAGGAAGALLPLYGLTRDSAAPLLARVPKGIRAGHVMAAGGLLGALGGGYLGHKAMGALQNAGQNEADEGGLSPSEQLWHRAQLEKEVSDAYDRGTVVGAEPGEESPFRGAYHLLQPEHWDSIYRQPHIGQLVSQYGGRADHPAVDAAVYAEADKLLGR